MNLMLMQLFNTSPGRVDVPYHFRKWCGACKPFERENLSFIRNKSDQSSLFTGSAFANNFPGQKA